MIDDLHVGTVALNPGQHILEHALDMAAIVTNDDAGDVRGSMLVIRPDFCAGEVELPLQTRQQGFQTGAFFLQRTAAREVEFEHQCANMHPVSLDEEHSRHKHRSRYIIRACLKERCICWCWV